MVKLKALKTFSAGGAKLTMQGTEFDAPKERAQEYLRLQLAEEIHDPTANEATAPTDEVPTQAPTNMTTEFAEEATPDVYDRQRADNAPNEEQAKEVAGYATDYTEEELSMQNVKQLKDIAKDSGVTGYSTMTKSELIFAIRAKQNYNKAMEV